MKHRKLRIAWSVAWGIAAVLLVGLWVRSYQYWERVVIGLGGTHAVETQHVRGQVKIIQFSEQHITPGFQLKTSIWAPLKLTIEEWSKQDRRRSDNGLPTYFPSSSTGIGGEITSTRYVLFLPYWFLVSAATFAAITVWMRWSNRFSLRTMLIATTLIAVVLGLIVWLR